LVVESVYQSTVDRVDNTWNAYACNINETVVVENARLMNESGLLKAGYDYFVIDGALPRINIDF